MFLSDIDIRKNREKGNIIINPFEENNLQQASYDLRISNVFLVFDYNSNVCIDPKKPIDKMMQEKKIKKNDYFCFFS